MKRPGVERLEYPLSALVAGLAMAGLLWVLSPLQPPPRAAPRERPAENGSDAVIMVAVGDILLGHAAIGKIREHGYGYPFEQVSPLLAEADLVSGNLEAPASSHDQRLRPKKKWTYKQSPAVTEALRNAGFDLLVLANNHAMDYGATGLLDTVVAVEDAGMAALGAGADERSARRGLVVEVGDVRVSLPAYQEPRLVYDWNGYFARGDRPGIARLDRVSVAADIERLRAEADVVVVQCHFGRNYTAVLPSQERLARGIVDVGADAVIGHHSHNAQGVEVYRGVPILYSLGNFTFGTAGRFEEGQPGYGLVARLHIRTGGVEQVDLDLIGTNNKIVKYQPTVIAEEEARPVLEALVEPYGTALRWEGSTAVLFPMDP